MAMARWVASAALAAGALVTGSRSTATTDTAKASGEDEYDVYVRHPRVEDLKILVERFEKGGQSTALELDALYLLKTVRQDPHLVTTSLQLFQQRQGTINQARLLRRILDVVSVQLLCQF